MKYITTNFALVLFVLSTTLVLGSTTDAYADLPIPLSEMEIIDYIGIGLGDGSAGNSIAWSNYEIGANKNFVPSQGEDCQGPSISGNPALPSGIFPIPQGKLFDAGTAITDPAGKIDLSNIGIYSSFGIRMEGTANSERVAFSDAYYNDPNDYPNSFDGNNCGEVTPDPSAEMTINGPGFADNYDFSSLLDELFGPGGVKESIDAMTATQVLDLGDGSVSSSDLYINLISGLNVIDVDINGDTFSLSNSNLVFDGPSDAFAIMRIPVQMDISNSNILISDTGIQPFSVVLYSTKSDGGDTFNFSNGILNGISFWSLNQQQDKISLSNGQGCSQAIADYIDFSNVRFVKCAFLDIPDSILTLTNVVVNDDNGNEGASAWTLTATDSNNVKLIDAPGIPDTGEDITATIDAVATVGLEYTLSESGPPGYTASVWSCTGGTFVSPDKITLLEGESTTCTITNDDLEPNTSSLTIIKEVVNDNGGANVPSDFTMVVTAKNPSDNNFLGSSVGTTITIGAGPYSVTETGPEGYAANFSTECSGIATPDDVLTCTITNDDIPPIDCPIGEVLEGDVCVPIDCPIYLLIAQSAKY